MADFKETLEVVKNSSCFFAFCWTKEDLAVLDENELPAPPMEIEWSDDATLGEVVDKIEYMSNSEDQCQAAINQLFATGKVTLTDEY